MINFEKEQNQAPLSGRGAERGSYGDDEGRSIQRREPAVYHEDREQRRGTELQEGLDHLQERRTGSHFYVLAAGGVHIDIGATEGTLAVNRPGEVFGWSALVEPYAYTATAKCVRDAKVIKISSDVVEAAIQEHPAEGLAVLKNLNAIIAGRLRYAYRQLVPEA